MSDVRLSKSLSWLLRHGAIKEGLPLSEEGFIEVDKLLQHKSLRSWSIEDVKKCVESNDKKRFSMRVNSLGRLEIKANQGHSIKEIGNTGLMQIKDFSQIKCLIHGTYYRNLNSILSNGLSRMGRNHIHFAQGSPKEVTSGFRNNCEVLIYVNVQKALQDLPFFISKNGVVLTPGNSDGILSPNYFENIIDRKTGKNLMQ